jgi:hypothetical protein
VRKNHADPAHHEENCRSYAANFFEAATARQAASFCKDDIDRERILELLDSEIEALNNVIATSLQRVMTCRRSIWVGVKISAPTARDERHLQL